MWFPEMDQKSFLASPSSGGESWNGGEDPSDSPWRFPCSSPRSGLSWIKVDVLRTLSLHLVWLFHLRPGIYFSPFVGVDTSFALSLSAWISDASIFLQFLNVCDHRVSFSDSTRVQYMSRGIYLVRLSWRADAVATGLLAEIGWYSTTAPNGILGPLNGSPDRLS